jgi:hypothetical protein
VSARSKTVRRGLVLSTLLLLTSALLLGWWALDRVQRFAEAVSLAGSALDRAPAQPFEALAEASAQLVVARAELTALRPVAQPLAWFATTLRDVPVIGPPAHRAAAAWDFADASTSFAMEAAAAAKLAIQSASAGRGVAEIAHQAPAIAGHLAIANGALQRARAARAALGDPPAWPFDRLAPQLARWDGLDARMGDRLGEAAALASVVPAVLGADRPAIYLVLVQTSDDLRATGGFITSIGSVEVEDGQIRSISFEKVFAAEGIDVPSPTDADGPGVSPPAPLSRYMGLGALRLRDANWWASYPTSARQAASFWEAHKGVKVDGVIAITEDFLEGILRAVGPMQLSDRQIVTAEEVKTQTLSAVFKGDEPSQWYANQTGFSQALAGAIVDALQHLASERMVGVAIETGQLIERRDLLFASFDSKVASALRPIGMDGELGGARDDYLYVVEQNVSYGKLSPFIHQSFDYTVQIDETARPVFSRLTIDVENAYTPGAGLAGYPANYYWGWWWNPVKRDLDGEEGFYGGYTRIFFPPTGTVLGASGFDDGVGIGLEDQRPYLGGYSALKRGARRRIIAEWTPAAIMSTPGRYRLLVQRQPGAAPRDVTVRVRLPVGYTASTVTGAGRLEEGAMTWRAELDRDQVFELTIKRSTEADAPRP